MKVRIVPFALIFAVLLLAPAAAIAKKKSSTQEGSWNVRVTPDAEAAAKGEKANADTLVLFQGFFRSSASDQYGFSNAPYTMTGKTFTAQTKSVHDGVIDWSGTWNEDSIAGRISWKKQDGTVMTYTYSGKRAPVEKAKHKK